MKKIFLPLLVGVALLVTSCALLQQHSGPATQLEAKSRAKIVSVEDQINSNTSQKLDKIAGFSFATDYALGKITNATKEVVVAREMNKRVESITGSPTLAIMKDMQGTVDNLLSIIQAERLKGEEQLALKDADITALQNASKQLQDDKDKEVRNYMTTAQIVASSADAYKDALSDYQGWFGLKAVFKGLGQFIKTSLWVLIGGSILFLILRLLAASNPIAGAIFSIFDTVLSWVVNTIRVLAPRALQVAGTVEKEVYTATKNTLTTIVDCVETAKIQGDASGKPATIEDLLNTAELSMTPADKALIDKLKVQLGWAKPSVSPTVSPIIIPSAPVTSSISPVSGSVG